MRYLSVDFGERRIGLAVCDPAETVVSPLGQIERRDDDQAAGRIARTVADERIDAVVVGLPINADGSEGPQAKRVRKFADRLTAALAVPIHFQDEQLSSFAADERLAQRELTRGRKRLRHDALAAAVILEDFLRAGKGT